MKIENRTELKEYRIECQKKQSADCRVLVCGGTGCLASGSGKIYEKLKELTKDHTGVEVKIGEEIAHTKVMKSGCHGFCEMGPLVRIEPYNYLYIKVKLEDCEEIYNETILGGRPVERLLYKMDGVTYPSQEEIPFYAKQTRLVLKNCGHIDAEHIGGALAVGAYAGIEKALFEMTPEAVIQTIYDSNLRGRGGAGFRTGRKWQQVASQKEKIRYVVCNGDEGDPGAFMDRSIMEGDPHRMIEGMMIAAYAVQAQEGYIYVRAEYPLAIERLKTAISQAEAIGLLGDNILGTNFSFHLHINRGAGAFVCGEGSALTASIEGKRGMPRVKPPRTVEQGLWARPTVLNNVETYANVPMIVTNGADWFKGIGTPESPGTKAFALTGNVRNTGLIEVPMGITLREVIYDIGGGIQNDKKFKAVQIGGPSGGCLTEDQLDSKMDFDSLAKIGAMIGSGGLVIMDEDTCMVEVARFFMSFTQRESCGKCVPCREGTKRMLEILERIVAGNGKPSDMDELRELADMIESTALCGLGKSAPKPVISTMNAFEEEYLEHINEKRCRTGVCSNLRKFQIDPEICKGCSKCARNCPAWVKFCENRYPDLAKNLSTCRSPQQMFGAVIREYYKDPEKNGGKRIVSVSIMPCTAKKEEILRPESSTNGKQDIDYVLTTTELITMIRKSGIRFENLEIEASDMPFGIGSGAGVIFGVTGGVTEAVLRRLREGHNRVEMDKIKFSGVRGEEGLKEVEFDYNGRTIHAAVVSGLGNADALMKKIQKGEVHYDFVEVMACRRGCIMGGGQPVPAGPRSRIARSKGLYDTDINTQIKKSNENPLILSLYDELLKGKTHELLHRNFEAAKK